MCGQDSLTMIVCDFFFFLKWTPPPSKPRALCHRWFRPWQELQSASPFKGQEILTFPDRNVSQENSGFCRCPTKLYVQLLIDVGWWWTAWSSFKCGETFENLRNREPLLNTLNVCIVLCMPICPHGFLRVHRVHLHFREQMQEALEAV